MSDAEDKELSDAEKEEKRKEYETELKIFTASWESCFRDLLNRLVDDEHWDVLDFYSPVTGKELYDSLTELWSINFQIYYQKAIIEESGLYGVEIKKRSVSYSLKKRSEHKTMNSEEEEKIHFATNSLSNNNNNERRKTKRELRLKGKGCHSFWLTKKWEKLGEVVSGHMMEEVKKRAENDVGVGLAKFSIMYPEFFEHEEDKVITKEQRHKDLAAAKTKAKAWEDSMLALMKEATAGFVKDLADVKQKVKHDLEGWRYHWKRFSEVAVLILALSTFALAALRIWLALKTGALSVVELTVAVGAMLLVIAIGILGFYKMNK